jgi:thioredoxin 1
MSAPYFLNNPETMGRITELNDGDFDTTIVQTNVPILVDFWSPTCAPCRTLTPILEELSEENDGDAAIAKVNAAQYPALVARHGIDTLPTLLLFHRGKVIERMVGVQSKHKLQSALDEVE